MNEDMNDSAIVFVLFVFFSLYYGNVCFQFKNWKNSKLIFYLLELFQNEDVNDSAIVFVLFVCLFFSVFTMEMFVFNLRIGKTPSSSFIC